MYFTGKTIIVTGASSGIGKSCCEKVLSCGGNVIGIDINSGTISNDNYTHLVGDISSEESVSKIIESISSENDHIDGLVNAAGIWGCGKPINDIELESFRRIIDVNLIGTYLMSRYAAKLMIPRKKGKIVNISCIRASIQRKNMADYAATKGAIVSLTSSMALDLAEYNIQVNSVAPGFTYTGMTKSSFDNPEVRTQSEMLIPAGRLGMPEDISSVVLFLLSDMSDYVTGSNIFADGGYHIQK